MPNDGSTPGDIWPLPKFSFTVTFVSRGISLSVREVSGLDTESPAIEYRHGGRNAFAGIKLPESGKTGSVIFKRGIFANGDQFRPWYKAIQTNTITRETVVIQLLDESGKPSMSWTLTNAWLVKITGVDPESDTGEVVIETMELAHEGLVMNNGG